VKPFPIRGLILRVRAAPYRPGFVEPRGNSIKVKQLLFASDCHIACIAGIEIILTSTEYKLLLNLAEKIGRVQSRLCILKDVLEFSHVSATHKVDAHITRLRTTLGTAGGLIRTVCGSVYKMEVM